MFNKRNAICGHVSLGLVIGILLFSSLSHATILRKLSLDGLVSHADTIIVGTCEKIETIWLARKIYTVATIRVEQSAKGKARVGSPIKVYILGGRVKKPIPVKMHVPGAAKVVRGEEMVLFLKAVSTKKQHHRFVGMAQGKIPIKTDAKTGKKSIGYNGSIKGIKMVDHKGKPINQHEQIKAAQPSSLENFLVRLKQIMADQEAKAKKAAEQKGNSEKPLPNKKGGVK